MAFLQKLSFPVLPSFDRVALKCSLDASSDIQRALFSLDMRLPITNLVLVLLVAVLALGHPTKYPHITKQYLRSLPEGMLIFFSRPFCNARFPPRIFLVSYPHSLYRTERKFDFSCDGAFTFLVIPQVQALYKRVIDEFAITNHCDNLFHNPGTF